MKRIDISEHIIESILQFHKFTVEKGNIEFIEIESYDSNEAFYWKFPDRAIVTYAPNLNNEWQDIHKGIKKQIFTDAINEELKTKFETTYDFEFILDKDDFNPYVLESIDLTYRQLTKDDLHYLEEMKTYCSKTDLQYGQVEIEDPLVIGAFHKTELVAAASIWELPGDLADIGILVSSTNRKKGFGCALVSYLCDQILDTRTPLYRADYDNPGSVKIAQKLGFTEVVKVYRYK